LKKGESQQKEEGPGGEATSEESAASAETMKGLLEEANRILKGLSARTGEAESRTKDERLTAMQGQLDELRKLKVLRLSRIGKEQEAYGLLDSGATNAWQKKRRRSVTTGRGPGDAGRRQSGRDEDNGIRSHGGGR
jgi:hypothetical protein